MPSEKKMSGNDPDFMNQSEPEASTADVKTLLKEHAKQIDELQNLVADKMPKGNWDGVVCKYDEIFFLRYILSFGTAEAAVDSVLKTFAYRKDPKYTDMIKEVFEDKWKDSALAEEMWKYDCAGIMEKGQPNGGFTVVARGNKNSTAKWERITFEEHVMINLAYREDAFQKCDKVTRETGQLVKQVVLFDMKGVSLGQMMDPRQSKVHQEITAMTSHWFPQLLSKMVLVNTPGWMTYVMAVFRKILPARNMDKIELYASVKDMWQSEWGSKALNKAGLPAFLGGDIPDSELADTLTGVKILKKEDEEMASLTVANRGKELVDIVIPIPNCQVNYLLSVEDKGILVSAELIQDGEKKPVEMRAPVKIKAEAGPERGVWKCDKPGKLRVTFDNSYSVLRKKTVRYQFDLVAPTESS